MGHLFAAWSGLVHLGVHSFIHSFISIFISIFPLECSKLGGKIFYVVLFIVFCVLNWENNHGNNGPYICFTNVKLIPSFFWKKFFLGKNLSVYLYKQYIHIYIHIYINNDSTVYKNRKYENKQTLYRFHLFRVIRQGHRAFYNKNHQNHPSDMINHKYNLLCKV